jgi:ATP-dependent Clp protease ATP-binding subunit ClpA
LARREPRRPATFFAVGPTGVGKTSTAEALRSALGRLLPAADGLGYVRIDASELAEEHRVSQLVGAPPGYVGYQDGAELIDTLMITPRALVVFDEIEKAHPVVLRVLLNLLDAGRLSSPDRSRQRQTIDARQAVLFFTTNLRSEAILEELATRQALGDAGTVDAVCRRHLRRAGLAPELVGRIGSFLAFSPLSPAARAEIIELAIARVAGEYGLQIASVSRSVIEGILAESITSDLGARPDEYLVDELLGDAFMAAASQAGQGRWRVTGPPFQCEPTE